MIRYLDDPALVPDWTDAELLEKWDEVSREPGDPWSDALAMEIERRGLDF